MGGSKIVDVILIQLSQKAYCKYIIKKPIYEIEQYYCVKRILVVPLRLWIKVH